MSVKLTKAQREVLSKLNADGFVEHVTDFSRSQANKPLWTLVKLGLADFDWGPKGSFLKTQGFVATSAGRATLSNPTRAA